MFFYEYLSDRDIDNSISQLYKSDDELILGSWKMDTSKYGEGWDADLNGRIVKVTFYSDGSCIVGGWSSSEDGTWSFVDDNLKIQGMWGGMFWNYNGFISPYSLSEDKLIIYEDDGITISD